MYIPQTNSTNTLILEQLHSMNQPMEEYSVYTFHQTAGRGQQGNTWESEPNKNLLFSRLIRPTELHPAQLFQLTQWVSIIVLEVLQSLDFKLQTADLSIKWPNDIYWKDKKLCGILIESAFAGAHIDYAVAGVGINVSQTIFRSNAPNPISLFQITGKEIELHHLMQQIDDAFVRLRPLLSNTDLLQTKYMQHLYRRTGWHQYLLREVSTTPTTLAFSHEKDTFLAQITDVLPNGTILLCKEDGTKQTFHFKEIRFVL